MLSATVILNIKTFMAAFVGIVLLMIVANVMHWYPTRACPNCGGEVKITSRTCPHCLYRFNFYRFID